MSFIVYDLILLAIFAILIGIFLYRKRKEINKEGLLLLYRTRWGIKLIDSVGNKYKKTLKVLSYFSVTLGYLLMIGVVWLFYTITKVYVFRPDVVSAIKVPPIMPLIPYIDKVVPFLPPFYFTYWIVILGIIAITHEFAHGIFAAYNKVKTKKTGFGFFPFFLPVFLAAFVELDEKVMVKRNNFGQRAILAAGTFANVITSILFFLVLGGFFLVSFTPAGVTFDDYIYNVVNVSDITQVNGISIANPNVDSLTNLVKNSTFNNITAAGQDYVGIKTFSSDETLVALYLEAPAIRSGLNGAITEINNIEVKNMDELGTELAKYSPRDKIIVTTKTLKSENKTEIILVENPSSPGKAQLGVAFTQNEGGSFMSKIFSAISSFKKPHVYYESKVGEFGWFIYHLLWWLIIISLSVALVNMLPMGIFDGGRFFYLTILAITGSEKIARKSFKILTTVFLALVFLLMVLWAYALIF